MSTRPAIDVLIPSLDRPEALKRAIASLRAVQKAEPALDIRPQVITRDLGSAEGPAAARNRAAAQGNAEFIALLDDDDEWLSPRLGEALSLLAARPDIALVAGDASLTEGGNFLDTRAAGPDSLGHAALILDCFVCTSTVTMRRSDWEEFGGMAEELGRAEDYDLWLRITKGGRKVHLIRRPLAHYDNSGGGLSSDSVAMAGATLIALERSARAGKSPAWHDRIGRLEAVISHGLSKSGDGTEARALALRALRHSPGSKVAWTSAIRALGGLVRFTAPLLAVGLTLATALAPSAAVAEGFGQLHWGMTRTEAASTYSGQSIESEVTKSQPRGTDGGVLRILADSELFGLPVTAEAHFRHDQLAVVRLSFLTLQQGNVDKVLEVYSSNTSPPLRSIRSSGGRKTTTWSWPWDGRELRSVSDGGELKYQRLDISAPLQRRWLSADAAVCSILPGSSTCNLEHRFCPSAPTSPRKRPQQHSLDVAGKAGEVTCSYTGEALSSISLAIPGASDVTADWLELIFESRLGEGAELRDERGSSTVQLRTAWKEHGVEMLVVRKAYVETKSGWSGPVEFLRIQRVVSAPQ